MTPVWVLTGGSVATILDSVSISTRALPASLSAHLPLLASGQYHPGSPRVRAKVGKMGRPGRKGGQAWHLSPSARGGRGRALAARGRGLLGVASGLPVESGVGKGRVRSPAACLAHQWGRHAGGVSSCLSPIGGCCGDGFVRRQDLSLPTGLHPSQPPV